jgi:perosamine synthetase
LYGLLKALGVREGDEVIIPAFTCVVVPNAILYCGAKPVYADIDPETYLIDPEKVKALLSAQTRIIIAQNTFGLSSDLNALQEIANSRHITLLDDCTHGFGGTYKGQQNGTLAAASFFSSQWNKTFSTGLGGFVFARDPELAEKMYKWEKQLPFPPAKAQLSLKAQLFARRNILRPSIYWPLVKLYRRISAAGLISGSSEGLELEQPVMPENYAFRMSDVQAKKGIREINRLQENLSHRKKIAEMYSQCLSELGLRTAISSPHAEHTFIQYPILVKDPRLFTQLAEKNHIPLNNWMCSPLHPVTENLERWYYPWGKNPVAEKISQHILNLPTDLSISISKASQICRFIREHRDQFEF